MFRTALVKEFIPKTKVKSVYRRGARARNIYSIGVSRGQRRPALDQKKNRGFRRRRAPRGHGDVITTPASSSTVYPTTPSTTMTTSSARPPTESRPRNDRRQTSDVSLYGRPSLKISGFPNDPCFACRPRSILREGKIKRRCGCPKERAQIYKISGRENLRLLLSTTGQVSVVDNNNLKFQGASEVTGA